MLLCGLDAAASVLEFLALASSRAEGTGDAALCNDRFDHSVSNIVPGTLGNHSATHQPLSGAHSTRQVTQAIAQPSRVQFLSEILKQSRGRHWSGARSYTKSTTSSTSTSWSRM